MELNKVILVTTSAVISNETCEITFDNNYRSYLFTKFKEELLYLKSTELCLSI